MSARRDKQSTEVANLRRELNELKEQTRAVETADIMASETHTDEFDKLTQVEQSAASLGVKPDAWKPIAFLNNAHYEQLIASNMLDEGLARRIEAYKSVASSSS